MLRCFLRVPPAVALRVCIRLSAEVTLESLPGTTSLLPSFELFLDKEELSSLPDSLFLRPEMDDMEESVIDEEFESVF